MALILKLSARPLLQVKTALECVVCTQLHDGENQLTEALLFGVSDHYAICPSCGKQPVNKEDAEYQRKVRVYVYQKFGHGFIEKARLPAPLPDES